MTLKNRFREPRENTSNHQNINCQHSFPEHPSSDLPLSVPKAPQLQQAIGLYESLSRQKRQNFTGLSYISPPSPYQRHAQAATSKSKPPAPDMTSFGSSWRKLSGSWSRTRLAKTMSKRCSIEHRKTPVYNGKDGQTQSTLTDREEAFCGPLSEHSRRTKSRVAMPNILMEAEPRPFGSTLHPSSESFPFPLSKTGDTTVLVSPDENGADDGGDALDRDTLQHQQACHGCREGEAKPTEPANRLEISPSGARDERRCSPQRPSRRHVSRSSGAPITRAHCVLEHPRPVRDRGHEVKRLVSLCRDKVATGWKSRVQSA